MSESITAPTLEMAHLAGRMGTTSFQQRIPGNVKALAETRHNEDSEKKPVVSDGMTSIILLVSICLLVFALLLYGLAHLVGDGISRAGHTNSQKALEIVIGNDVLNVRENVVRYPSQRYSGAHKRLELYMHWPNMTGYSDENRKAFNMSANKSNLLFVTLEPRTMSYDMSGRIIPIYSRFFEGKKSDAGHGLIRQPLSAEGGYIDEDLYYEKSSPYPFAVRCVREGSTVSTPFCIRDIHIGKGLMLTYRFHKKFLAKWIGLDQAIRAAVQEMLVSAR